MKKTLKVMFLFIIAGMIFLPDMYKTDNAYAEAEATITVSADRSEVNVGENVKVTVKYEGKAATAYLAWNFTYPKTKLEHIPGSGEGKASGVINEMLDFSQNDDALTVTKTYVFKALEVGEAEFGIRDIINYRLDNKGGTLSDTIDTAVRSTKINVIRKSKSNNADLASLSASSGTLTPSFSKDITEYKINVPISTNPVYIYAQAADGGAKVELTGADEYLETGDNRRIIVVTAEDGTVKKYTVNIIRAQAAMPAQTPSLPTAAPTEAHSPTAEPTATPDITETPDETEAPINADGDGDIVMGQIRTPVINFTVYNIEVYLERYAPEGASVDADIVEFLLGDTLCKGISRDGENNNGQFIVLAKSENGTKQLYSYDINDGSMQRYYGALPSYGAPYETDISTPITSTLPVNTNTQSAAPDAGYKGSKSVIMVVAVCAALAAAAGITAVIVIARKGREEESERFENSVDPEDFEDSDTK